MKTLSRILVIFALLFGSLGITTNPLGGKQGQAKSDDSAERYLAIVDVYVTNDHDSNPNALYNSGYTALNWTYDYTSPYILGSNIGTYVPGADINAGIGGDFVYIWVKYDWVAPTDDTPVLVDFAVHHWPYWEVDCPKGWTSANGDAGGALTTRADDSCWRNGLCVHFVPMNQTDSFITNPGIYFDTDPIPDIAPLALANGGYWPLAADVLDIHKECGDDKWMYLLYNDARKWPAMPVALPSPSDAGKALILQSYAPQVWLAGFEIDHPEGEIYYPSPVEWSFDNLWRVFDSGLDSGSWRLYTKQALSSPSDVLPYFHGCDGVTGATPCTLSDTPVYAFWDEVEITDTITTTVKAVDLNYFFYYPYNRGKEVADTIWGNHVGDWEYISMRLLPQWDEQAGWSFGAAQVYLSVHDFGRGYLWDQIPTVMGDVVLLPLISKMDMGGLYAPSPATGSAITGGTNSLATHPVIYSAWGSHGVWLDPGVHVYQNFPVLGTPMLFDVTSAGTAWKTWRWVEAYNYDNKTGLSGNSWPVWMGTDFYNPDVGNSDPASGPINRWGNPEDGCILQPVGIDDCRLNPGPTGPVSKNVWDVQRLR